MAVNAMADCTVAGNTHRYNTPTYSSGVTSGSNTGRNTQPSNGNNTNVAPTTTRCSRQCDNPALMASRESLAPCRKNSSAMAATVTPSITRATAPEAGNTLASVTTHTNAKVKLSGRKRERVMKKAPQRPQSGRQERPNGNRGTADKN